ncbi:MAG: homoserine kinase [Pelosinus sp.]|nr:homoserine kinase [Pelosinus sp.]
MAITVKVQVPGTTANCGSGFDAVGMACTIYNDFELTLTEKPGFSLKVTGEGAGAIPEDDRNIALQAIKLVFEKVGQNYQGIQIKMHNRIPLARGLGSSAAAIVAGLVAANEAAGGKLTKQDILDMATQIEGHPDNVAPAIFGGITVSTVSGDKQNKKAHCLRFMPDKLLNLIVAVPDFKLSTKAARQVLPEAVPLKDAVFNISRVAMLIGALSQGEFQHLGYGLEDRLHQPYREKLIPGMQDVFKAANKNGALGSAISGAGPCLIAFAEGNTKQIGDAMVAAFAKHNISASYYELSIDPNGAKVIS